MTYTVITDGDDGLASPVMGNFEHAGRLSFSSFYPMNTSGAYALQDLGETGKEWGNLYLASGKKIYINGIEFKGGGAGGALEVLEQKSHLEKNNINYPLSLTDGINEAFVNTENVTITPRVTYVSGTTFIADYNKTDIDLMNATTGWTAGTNTPTVAQDTTNKIEGTGSVKMTKASLNGSIDMYKTFTAFSLVDQLLTFSFYPDTITNVTRFYVKIESSASNDKTYYVPVANITAAAWNHISIDPTNDTADASTGTLVPGSITKIYFGYTTSSSQTVNVSVDFVVYQPNWILPVPASLYIWDGTNQERIEIASVAGTANHQRRTYTITALSNGYAVGAAYAKERNVTISGLQGIFPTGLSGAVAKTVYDQTCEHLPTSLSGKTLTMSQRFWDEEFKISSLPSTTSTKLSSATDKSGYFKTGDKVILYHKRYEGRKYNSRYNSTVAANFKIVTLTSDGTYASSEITLAHTGEVNSGADTSYWYAVRYSAEMLYKLEAETEAGALSTLTPSIFFPSLGNASIFEELFNRSNGAPANDWTIATEQTLGTVTGYAITSQELTWSCASGASNGLMQRLYRNKENYSLRGDGHEITFRYKMTSTAAGNGNYIFIGVGSANVAITGGYSITPVATSGVAWSGSVYSSSFSGGFYNGASSLSGGSGSISFTEGSYYNIKIIITKRFVGIKVWLETAAEPGNYLAKYLSTTDFTNSGDYLVFAQAMNSGNSAYSNYIDNIRVKTVAAGYIVRGSVDGLTGSKFTTATKLTRQDTTNQNPIIYQRSAILS